MGERLRKGCVASGPSTLGLSRNNHSSFGSTSGAGLHPAADFQSAACNWIVGPKSADAIGVQDAILPHLVRPGWNSYFLASTFAEH